MIKRRDFFSKLFTYFGTLSIFTLLAGCGQRDETEEPSSTTTSGNVPNNSSSLCNRGAGINVATNHGHSLLISPQDVLAATPRSYNIQGNASHGHAITLTANDFLTLQNGGTVRIQSQGGSHSHMVVVGCFR